MDKNLVCHTIALEVAKTYVQSNLPEYLNHSGSLAMAQDMTQKYIDAYIAASDVFGNRENLTKTRNL